MRGLYVYVLIVDVDWLVFLMSLALNVCMLVKLWWCCSSIVFPNLTIMHDRRRRRVYVYGGGGGWTMSISRKRSPHFLFLQHLHTCYFPTSLGMLSAPHLILPLDTTYIPIIITTSYASCWSVMSQSLTFGRPFPNLNFAWQQHASW